MTRTGLLSSTQSSRHSGNKLDCPRSAPATKRFIDPPRNHQGNHSTLSVFTQPGSEAAIHLPACERPFLARFGPPRDHEQLGWRRADLAQYRKLFEPVQIARRILGSPSARSRAGASLPARQSPVRTLLGTSQASSTSTMALRSGDIGAGRCDKTPGLFLTDQATSHIDPPIGADHARDPDTILVFASSSAAELDHVMGFARLLWIPISGAKVNTGATR